MIQVSEDTLNIIILLLYISALQLLIIILVHHHRMNSIVGIACISVITIVIILYQMHKKRTGLQDKKKESFIRETFFRELFQGKMNEKFTNTVPQAYNRTPIKNNNNTVINNENARNLKGLSQDRFCKLNNCNCEYLCRCNNKTPDYPMNTTFSETVTIIDENAKLVNNNKDYSTYSGEIEPSQNNNVYKQYSGENTNQAEYLSAVEGNIDESKWSVDYTNISKQQGHPECCPSTYSTSTGCLCMTDDNKNLILRRGVPDATNKLT